MIFRMTPLRLLISGALVTLLAAWTLPSSAQSMSSSELRNMSAAEFQRHIDDEGA
jgi:hypothetical protein